MVMVLASQAAIRISLFSFWTGKVKKPGDMIYAYEKEDTIIHY